MADDRKRGPVRDSGATITRKIVPGRLRREERKLILDKLIKENGRQNSRLRRKIRERLDRQVHVLPSFLVYIALTTCR